MYKRELYVRSRERWTYKTLRFDKETWDDVQEEASRRNLTQNELVRIYVEWGLETDGVNNR